VSVIAPTGYGKSTLLGQIITAQDTEQLTVIVDTKPKNKALDTQLRGLGFRTVTSFPPILPGIRLHYERRWRVRPPHTGIADVDAERLRQTYMELKQWLYLNADKYGGCRLVVDEGLDLVRAGLSGEIEQVHTHGREMMLGEWIGTQRPRGVPLTTYSMAGDLFIANNPDLNDQKRYSEIGGIDPKALIETVSHIKKYEFLYLHRDPLSGAIIDAG